MAENERVAADDVRRVAELANLELTEDEGVRMQRDLNAILDYVAQLNEFDTSAVAPMAQVSDVLRSGEGVNASLREDRIVPSLGPTTGDGCRSRDRWGLL